MHFSYPTIAIIKIKYVTVRLGLTHCTAHISFQSPSKKSFEKCNYEHKNVTFVPLALAETRAGQHCNNNYNNSRLQSCSFGTFAKLRKLLASSRLSFGSQWTDFHGIWYLTIFRKSVEKIQVSLKSDNNNRYCTCRPIYIIGLSRSILLITGNVSQKVEEKIKKTCALHAGYLRLQTHTQNM